MRLIDADALLEAYDREHVGPPGGARKLIEEAPTIEPAEDWIPFRSREMTEEERKEYPPEITGIWCEPLPDHGQEILVSDGRSVWDDTFFDDDYCYLDSGDDIKEGMAWMHKPQPYKPKEKTA